MGRSIRRWLAWSMAYFVVSLAIALLAHGSDLDQLTSRSALSRAAAVVDRLLWGPYHWIGRRLQPDPTMMRLTTPVLLLANALAWGSVLATTWRLLVHRRRST